MYLSALNEHHIGNISGPQYFAVELYLSGTHTKWCNNYGSWNDANQNVVLMQTFVHYSYYYTGGQKMVADLQSTITNSKYTLTDKAILGTVLI